jgi:hypothetical protein
MTTVPLTPEMIELLLVLLQVNRDTLEMLYCPDVTAMSELKLTKATIRVLEEAK